jgi:spore germination protein KC
MKKIIVIIGFILLISGCYDYRELNEMNIVTGIGINYKDDMYEVSLEVTKSIKDGSSNKIDTIIYTGNNKNLADAFLNAKNKSDKYVYMEHVNLLLLGKDIASSGIGDVLDYIIRDTTINSNYYMIVVDDPLKVLETKQESDSMSNVITNTINNYLDKTKFQDLDILSSYMNSKRTDIAIPSISIKDNKVIFNEVAYFSGDKYIGNIDSKLYVLLRLNSNNVNFSKNGNTINIYKNEIKYKIKNNKVIIIFDCDATIKEINKNIDLEKKNAYEYLNRTISKDIKNDIQKFLDTTLDKNSDLLGLRDKYYKKYKKDMKNIKYNIEVNLNINKNGSIYEVAYDK